MLRMGRLVGPAAEYSVPSAPPALVPTCWRNNSAGNTLAAAPLSEVIFIFTSDGPLAAAILFTSEALVNRLMSFLFGCGM